MAYGSRTDLRGLSLLQALIGWVTLGVVLVSVLALGANRPVSWTLLSMAVLPLFALQLMLDATRGLPGSARRLWPPALLFLGALSWGALQTVPGLAAPLAHPVWKLVPDVPASISADPLAGRQIVMRLSAYAMIFWIAARASADVDRAMGFLKAIAVFSTLLAGFGIIAAWSGVNPILQEDASATVSASFINRNSYATYAIFGAIANLAIYLHLTTGLESSGDLRVRGLRDFLESFFSGVWIFALGLLLCLAAVVLTQSRAGGVSGLLALLTFGVAYRFRGDRLNPILLAMLAAILGFVALSLASGVTERLLATGGEESRFQIYPLIVQGIAERPLLGHGLGAFQDTFRAFVPLGQASAEWELAHSSYLENAYELGLPAAAAFYLALGWVAAVIARGCLTRRHHRSFACVALACIVAGAFHSVFDFSLQMPASAALFAAILGIGWTQAFSRESRRRGSRRGTE